MERLLRNIRCQMQTFSGFDDKLQRRCIGFVQFEDKRSWVQLIDVVNSGIADLLPKLMHHSRNIEARELFLQQLNPLNCRHHYRPEDYKRSFWHTQISTQA